ncbi:MAG: aspartate aminotransferase family protein, partial [Pseudomonadota bacterium]
PVGAVAGPRKIMETLAPVGNVYQAGTLSANPLAMAAGLATLKRLTPETYTQIGQHTEKIISLFNRWFKEYREGLFSDYTINHFASLFWQVPSGKTTVDHVHKIPPTLLPRFSDLFPLLLKKGIYLAPNAYEVNFVSLAHGQSLGDLEQRLWKD